MGRALCISCSSMPVRQTSQAETQARKLRFLRSQRWRCRTELRLRIILHNIKAYGTNRFVRAGMVMKKGFQ